MVMEFVDVMDIAMPEMLQESYYAGSQLRLLEDCLPVNWIVQEQDDDYSGIWYAVFVHNSRWFVVNGYFGSCSGCDSLEDTNPLDWLKDYVKNIRCFETKEELISYLNDSEDYSWTRIKQTVIDRVLESSLV
jgi:hypothetical protein